MKLLVLLALFVAVLASTAYAGPPAANWSGFYAGVHGGYGSGIVANSIGLSGFLAGAQAGYLAQPGDNLVFGAQIDGSWANETGAEASTNTSYFTSNNTTSIATSVNRYEFSVLGSGSITGRVGYAWDRFLPYALGGVAVGWLANHYSQVSAPTQASDYSTSESHLHVGVTGGLGLEAKLTNQVSGFVEARYTDFGSANYTQTSSGSSTTYGFRLSDATVRAGFNFSFR
jgi:outer membrane immunogenic protein